MSRGYQAPTADLRFVLKTVLGAESIARQARFRDLDAAILDGVIDEGARFCEQTLAPLNETADREGARLVEGRVRMPPGFREAYRRFCADGWLGLDLPREYGGQALPRVVQAAFAEMVNGACIAFAMLPVTQRAAARLLLAHGDAALIARYAGSLVSGEAGATIVITEAQAGSDVGRIQSLARPDSRGGYRLTGNKIFISNGDQDLTDQIVHMVLARTPDAPPGTRGLSLFLVPKLLEREGHIATNDVRVLRLEHKMGLNGSPTCALAFEGARGFLLGELGRGLGCMFTMVNTMRLEVAVQGVALASAAHARAACYALERLQGGVPQATPCPIGTHADVRRMLLIMRARTEALRALTLEAALQLDLAESTEGEVSAVAARRAEWLLPICKACATDCAGEVGNLAIQLHGGHGYVRDSGIEQTVRDARIGTIYEGTNGIQALDLVERKLIGDGGRRLQEFAAGIRSEIAAAGGDARLARFAHQLEAALQVLQSASDRLLERASAAPRDIDAAATPYLRLAGLVAGGWMSLRMAQAAPTDSAFDRAKRVSADFYGRYLLPEARLHAEQIEVGAGILDELPLAELTAGTEHS